MEEYKVTGVPFSESVEFIKPPAKNRDALTETRGDDGTTSAGRKKISDHNNYEMRRRSTGSSTGRVEGTANALENQRSKSITTKSLESKKTRRAKRSGYNHAAAKSSDPDMLSMPAGGVSLSMAANLRGRMCPFNATEKAAGVLSEQMNKTTAWIGNKKPIVTKPIYFPQQTMNPINNEDVPADHKINLNRDLSKIQGAAGIASSRLTQMNATYIMEHAHKPRAQIYDSIDVIAHLADEPEQVRRGLKQFSTKQDLKDSVSIGHCGGPPQPMTTEEVAKWSKMKQVRIRGGEYRYNVAGHEDRLPASTNPYTKADRPPSQTHRRANDKRWLPKFYRKAAAEPVVQNNSIESEDMPFILGNDKDSDSGVGFSERQSRTSIYSDEGYIRSPPRPTRSASARHVNRSNGNSNEYRTRTPPPRPSYSESNYSDLSGRFRPPPRRS